MAQLANIVAFDGADTPVEHTFKPLAATSNGGEVIATWRENITSLPVYALPVVTAKLKRMGSGVYRAVVRTEVPVMEVTGPANGAGYTAPPKVAHTVTNETVGLYHERSTINERKLVKQLHTNILNGIATSVTPIVTGPMHELFVLLTTPN